jgi:hypothetical protein
MPKTKKRRSTSSRMLDLNTKGLTKKSATDTVVNAGLFVLAFWGGRKLLVVAKNNMNNLPEWAKRFVLPGAVAASGIAAATMLKDPKAKFIGYGLTGAGLLSAGESILGKSLLGLGLGNATVYELPADVPVNLQELEEAAKSIPVSGSEPELLGEEKELF